MHEGVLSMHITCACNMKLAAMPCMYGMSPAVMWCTAWSSEMASSLCPPIVEYNSCFKNKQEVKSSLVYPTSPHSTEQYKEQGFYDRLKDLIESTYTKNGKSPVVLLAHSMGAPTTLYFLTKFVDQPWKDKYLRLYITISGVWHGTAKSAKAFASGDNEGIWIVRQSEGRAGTRTYPSTAWLLPYPSDTWPKDKVLIVTPKRKYTAWDYKDLFADMNYTRGYYMFQEVMNLTGALPPPNVTMHCLYGMDVDTPLNFTYGPGEFPDTQPKTFTGNGDGSVNIDSLKACSRWKDQQPYSVSLKGFSGVEHVHTVKTDSIIQYVDSIVYSKQQVSSLT